MKLEDFLQAHPHMRVTTSYWPGVDSYTIELYNPRTQRIKTTRIMNQVMFVKNITFDEYVEYVLTSLHEELTSGGDL